MRVITHRVLLIMVSVILAACTSRLNSLNLHEGINSFRAQDYRQAFIRLKPEAEKGQPDAQYAIGYMYYYGQGVIENRKEAWMWIHQAARVGQPEAIEAVSILGGT